MADFDEFERDLQDTLNHLYDPAYRPSTALFNILGCDLQAGTASAQAAILQAIGEFKPAPQVPRAARSWRFYEVLSCRYLQKLTQEETAERLGITPRHLRREQGEAVHALAQHLWQASQARHAGPTLPGVAAETPDWLSQLKQELTALQKSAPGSVADVEATVGSVVALVSPITAKRGVTIQVGEVQRGVTASIHPAGLRQLLVHSMTEWSRLLSSGQIELSAKQTGDQVKITLIGDAATASSLPDDTMIRELLDVYGGSAQSRIDGNKLVLDMFLPLAARIKVLVVDDNPDLIHFYQRYVQGTRYQIVPLAEGTRALEVVETARPDVIVLDVMLPNIDGWELLTSLREHPAARSLPIIICSVVREEELALALGAARYIPKPVRRQEFIQALDQVLASSDSGTRPE
jgi:CheY-like chemotaxis protein